jgi:hypothetical protein
MTELGNLVGEEFDGWVEAGEDNDDGMAQLTWQIMCEMTGTINTWLPHWHWQSGSN